MFVPNTDFIQAFYLYTFVDICVFSLVLLYCQCMKTLHAEKEFHESDFPFDYMRTGLQTPYVRHTHDFTEINLITNGTIIESVNSRVYRLTQGSVVIMHKGDVHETTWAANASGMLVRFIPDKLRIETSELQVIPGYNALFKTTHSDDNPLQEATVLHLSNDVFYTAQNILLQIGEEFSEKPDGYRAQIRALLTQYIILLSRHYTQTATVLSHRFFTLAQTIQYIEQNFSEKITVDELAEIAGMKRRNFVKVFHKATGHAPIDYLIHYRVSQAAFLIRERPINMTEIALNCGFSDSNYFARQFRKIMHMSPTEYRKRVRKQEKERKKDK